MYKRHDAEVKVRVKRNPRKALRKLTLLIIATYVIFLTYGFVRDLVVTRLAKAEQVQRGVLQTTVQAKGLLIRNEKIVPAPRTGTLKVIAAEGERVRVGGLVAQVVVTSLDSKTGETVFNITAPKAGLVSYHLDGLEDIYTPKTIKELDLNKTDTIKTTPLEYTPGSHVEEGKPVLKIVNNLEPVSIIASLSGELKLPKGQKKLLISFGSDETGSSQGTLVDQKFRGKTNQILFSIASYDNVLTVPRKLDFKIIAERFEGYVLPASAMVQKEGKDGIFTVYKERVKWKKVGVVGKVQEKVVISGVTPDIKVILNPEYVKEGRPFKLP